MNLVSLQIKTSNNFEANLKNLKKLIISCEENSIIVAPELAVVGFAYDRMNEASDFCEKIIEDLKNLSSSKAIAITTIVKESNKFYNRLFIFYNQKIIHTQDKI